MLTFLKNNNLKFKKIASDFQLILNDAADLKQIINIDPALWAINSLPIDNVVFNYDFLLYIDIDNNKKIHPIEFIQSLKWLFSILNIYDAISIQSDILNLTTLNKNNIQSKSIIYAVRYINKQLKNKPKNIISLETLLNFDINNIDDELFLIGYNLTKKLLLFQRYMIQFANNYITVDSLYNPNTLSIMQPGYLIMNGNYYTLGCKVQNILQHKQIIKRSNIYTIYIQIISKTQKIILAFAITQNITQNLYIGKTGIFIDRRDNSQWDAKIIDIVQYPISLKDIFLNPFIKIHNLIYKNIQNKIINYNTNDISNQFNKMSKCYKQSVIKYQNTNLIKSSTITSISIAALGSASAFIISSLHAISILTILIFIFIIGILIYIPIICISLYKILNRSITEFYTASGWSINSKIKLSSKIGKIFTYSPKNSISMKIVKDDLIKKFIKQFQPIININKIIFLSLIIIILLLIIGYFILNNFC